MNWTARAVTNETGHRRTLADSIDYDSTKSGQPRMDVEWKKGRKEKIGNLKGSDAWGLLVEFILDDNPSINLRDVAQLYTYGRQQKRLDVRGKSYYSRGLIIGKSDIPSLDLHLGDGVVGKK